MSTNFRKLPNRTQVLRVSRYFGRPNAKKNGIKRESELVLPALYENVCGSLNLPPLLATNKQFTVIPGCKG